MKAVHVLVVTLFTTPWLTVLPQSVPPLVNYQGRLTDESGQPLPDGNYELAFRIFGSPVPGTEGTIWGQQYAVTMLGGVFNVVLGASGGAPVVEETSVNDLTFAFTEPGRYLELRIVRDHAGTGVNRTILPRQQLLSAPYALQAEKAANSDKVGGQAPSFWVPPGGMMAYGGTTDPPGWMICDGRAVSRADYAELFEIIGTRFGAGNGSTTFNLPNTAGLVLRGTGSQWINGRQKPGPHLGDTQEDQMQRLQGSFQSRRSGDAQNNVAGNLLVRPEGVFRLGMVESSSAPAAHARFTTSLHEVRFDSANSLGARVSGSLTGETRVSALGVQYIIKY